MSKSQKPKEKEPPKIVIAPTLSRFPIRLPSGACRTIEEFEKLETLQKCSSHAVYNCHDMQKDKHVTLVAYKGYQDRDIEFTDLLRELSILQKVKHVNVHKYLETIFNTSFLHRNYFIFEPIACYLSDLMVLDDTKLYNKGTIKNIMTQLLEGLGYLEENSIMHRNIHPGTIGFSYNGVLKVCHFRGAVFAFDKDVTLYSQEFRYQPPELLMMTDICGTPVDIWSAACIFAELLLRKPLFTQNNRERVLNDIFKLFGVPTEMIWPDFFKLPQYKYIIFHGPTHSYNCLEETFKEHGRRFSENTMDLLHLMFTYDPKRRFTPQQCLQFAYFSEKPEACSPEEVNVSVTMVVLQRKFHKLIKDSPEMMKIEIRRVIDEEYDQIKKKGK